MRSLLKRQNVSKVQICWPPLSLQHWSGPSHKKAAPPPSSVPWDPNLRFTNELADTKGPTHRAQQFYTPFMFGQMYVPVSMFTHISNTCSYNEKYKYTCRYKLRGLGNSTLHLCLVRSLEPPICSSWWLWPLCVIHDLKMSFYTSNYWKV